MGRVSSDILYYGATIGLSKLLSLGLVLIATRFLDPESFGVLASVMASAEIIGIIVSINSGGAFQHFYALAKSEQEKKTLFASWIAFSSIIFSLFLGLLFFFSEWLGQTLLSIKGLGLFLWVVVAVTLAQLLLDNFNQLFRYEFRRKEYVSVTVLRSVTMTSSIVILLALDFRLWAYPVGIFISLALAVPFYLYFQRSFLFKEFSFNTYLKIVVFGIPQIPMVLSWSLMTVLDRIMLLRHEPAAAGHYTAAAYFISAISVFYMAFGLAWPPRAYAVYRQNAEQAASYFSHSLHRLVYVLCALALLFSLISPELIYFSFPLDYIAAASIIPLLLFRVICDGSTYITQLPLMVTGRKYHLMVPPFLACFVNVGLNLALIPLYGLMGAAIATFISYAVLAGAYLWLAHRAMPFDLPARFWGLLVFYFAATVACVYFSRPMGEDSWIRLGIFLAAVLVYLTLQPAHFVTNLLKSPLRILRG